MKTTLIKMVLVCSIILAHNGLIHSQPSDITVTIIEDGTNRTLLREIENNTRYLINTINERFRSDQNELLLDRERFDDHALIKVIEMWENVRFFFDSHRLREQLLIRGSGYQLRNIPIRINGDTHYAVINFLKNGQISDFYVGLELHQYNNVMKHRSVEDKARREIILNFIENFRTAYIKKDIEFIENVFSEKALIITGRVIVPGNYDTDNIKSGFTERQVQYLVHTKQEYIQRLQGIFNVISYLNLFFRDIDVRPHRKYADFYGVWLDQEWNASNYSDRGYLFLLIQFRDNDFPLIWIRTWQDALDFEKGEMFGFHNFKIQGGTIQ